jgi:hypothetical protein
MSQRKIKSTGMRDAEREARKAERVAARKLALVRLARYLADRDARRRARAVAAVVDRMKVDATEKAAQVEDIRRTAAAAVGRGLATINAPASGTLDEQRQEPEVLAVDEQAMCAPAGALDEQRTGGTP